MYWPVSLQVFRALHCLRHARKIDREEAKIRIGIVSIVPDTEFPGKEKGTFLLTIYYLNFCPAGLFSFNISITFSEFEFWIGSISVLYVAINWIPENGSIRISTLLINSPLSDYVAKYCSYVAPRHNFFTSVIYFCILAPLNLCYIYCFPISFCQMEFNYFILSHHQLLISLSYYTLTSFYSMFP